MNIKLAGWIALAFLGTMLVASVWVFVFAGRTTQQQGGHQGNITFPVSSGSAATSTTAVIPAGTISIPSYRDGTPIVVNDFISDGVTLPDSTNPGRYLLAGNLGYCYPDSSPCEASPSSNYIVYFNAITNAFTIALTAEPLGAARLAMENFLLSKLGISKVQLCNLNYSVNVTRYVSEQYSGKNLGFSFCPGATVLP